VVNHLYLFILTKFDAYTEFLPVEKNAVELQLRVDKFVHPKFLISIFLISIIYDKRAFLFYSKRFCNLIKLIVHPLQVFFSCWFRLSYFDDRNAAIFR